ncbi:MAG: glycosyltransferase family 2 protein [Deltaproteobacteria bacterium]|nr:glycosyltransferase family 2 protein [Deltaproteobacteria bacterium]
MYKFSFLIPTRGRPQLVKRFFESILDTAYFIEEIEVILCLDDDDWESQNISDERLSIKKVVFPKGSNMGSLNRACFEASSGRYLILINDDVIIRTKGWDKTISAVYSTYSDDIALIHVNDLLFRESLCTFPILSRRACLKIGICPEEYRKYRIDDHIYDTYQMLAYLGHRRILYLADVVFEHDQKIRSYQTPISQVFKVENGDINLSNKEIIESDNRIFDEKFEARKQDAMKLACLIEKSYFERKQVTSQVLLNNIKDPYGYRKKDFVKKIKVGKDNLKKPETVTAAIVIPNIHKESLKKCESLVKRYASYYELFIYDDIREAISRLNGIPDPTKKRFVLRLVRVIQSNQFTLRLTNKWMGILGKTFNRYYNLPRYVRRVTDWFVTRLLRLYRTIQYCKKN